MDGAVTSIHAHVKEVAERSIHKSTDKTKADGTSCDVNQLEVDLRSLVLDIVDKGEVQNELGPIWKSIVTVCQRQTAEGVATMAKIPFVILEDIVDVLTPSSVLWNVWDNVVKPRTELCVGAIWESQSSRLQFIKVCNKLMHHRDDETKERTRKRDILLLLASVLSLSDRSSFKVYGSTRSQIVDVASSSLLLDIDGDNEDLPDLNLLSSSELGLSSTSANVHDQTFYDTFLELQLDFANPAKIKDFGAFLQKMKRLLVGLESNASAPVSNSTRPSNTPQGAEKVASAKQKRKTKSIPPSPSNNSSSSTLTESPSTPMSTLPFTSHSKRTLRFKLGGGGPPESSNSIVQHVLTQFLIVEAFLSSQSPALQSSLLPIKARCKELLDKDYMKHVDWILNFRECMWRNWKKSRCKPDLEDLVKPSMTASTKPRLSSSSSPKSFDFLSIPSMDGLKQLTHDMNETFKPKVQSHLEPYVDALDPESGIEEEYHPKKDSVYSWRALRLLSQDHLGHFSKLQRSNGDYENLVRHVFTECYGTDIPGEGPQAEVLEIEEAPTPAPAPWSSASDATDNGKQDTIMQEAKVKVKISDDDEAMPDITSSAKQEGSSDKGGKEETDLPNESKRPVIQNQVNPNRDRSDDLDVSKDTSTPATTTNGAKDVQNGDSKNDESGDDSSESQPEESEGERQKRYEKMTDFERAAAEEEEELERQAREERRQKRREEKERKKAEATKKKREEEEAAAAAEEKKKKLAEEEAAAKRRAEEADRKGRARDDGNRSPMRKSDEEGRSHKRSRSPSPPSTLSRHGNSQHHPPQQRRRIDSIRRSDSRRDRDGSGFGQDHSRNGSGSRDHSSRGREGEVRSSRDTGRDQGPRGRESDGRSSRDNGGREGQRMNVSRGDEGREGRRDGGSSSSLGRTDDNRDGRGSSHSHGKGGGSGSGKDARVGHDSPHRNRGSQDGGNRDSALQRGSVGGRPESSDGRGPPQRRSDDGHERRSNREGPSSYRNGGGGARSDGGAAGGHEGRSNPQSRAGAMPARSRDGPARTSATRGRSSRDLGARNGSDEPRRAPSPSEGGGGRSSRGGEPRNDRGGDGGRRGGGSDRMPPARSNRESSRRPAHSSSRHRSRQKR